jgi:hypothetical protein
MLTSDTVPVRKPMPVIDSTTASRGDNGTLGPNIRIRPGLLSK